MVPMLHPLTRKKLLCGKSVFKENLQVIENLQARKSLSIGKVTNLVEGVET
jgi:hypothetical protein